MAFPTIEEVLLPLLKITKEEKTYNTERAIRYVGKIFNLTGEEISTQYEDADNYSVYVVRELVRYSRDILRGAGLIEGYNKSFNVTKFGVALLKQKLSALTFDVLKQNPEYVSFMASPNADWNKSFLLLKNFIQKSNAKSVTTKPKIIKTAQESPLEEIISQKHQELDLRLKASILEKVKSMQPDKFELLVLEVAFHLAYEHPHAINQKDVIQNVGKTGDGGVDGIILKREKLKETKIYVQAKCWKDVSIGRPEIQKFVGALAGKKATDGIFITSSKFANTAITYAKESDFQINLVDGDELVDYMISFEIGVQKIATYDVKAIDTEYFSNRKKSK